MNKTQLLAASKYSKEFFWKNFYKIPVVGQGPTLFEPRESQLHVSKRLHINKLVVGLKARQIGWTTLGVADAFHDAIFNVEHPWLFVSRNEGAAIKMLAKAKYAYNRLPAWFQDEIPSIVSQTQTVLEFDNGSYLESVPATEGTGRGDAVYGALLDECAFMDYAEGIWGAVEPLVYGPAMIFSTANGMGNFFHDIWLDSTDKDSVWEGIFYPWSVVESRDAEWYERARRSFKGREWLFFQEYASNPEEAFAKSGRVAYGSDIVMDCYEEITPHAKFAWHIGEGAEEIDEDEEADIEVYQWVAPEVIRDEDDRPKYKPNYVVGADVAEGLEHGDLSYVTVYDANTGEQMVSCKTGMPVSYLDELIDWLGLLYFRALAIVERNNAGVLPLDRLYRDRVYPRLYRMDTIAEFRSHDRTPRYGWLTTPTTKPKMVNDYYHALREGKVLLHDPEFALEAQTFIADGKGSYGATSGRHDDVVMGNLITYQGVLDSPKYANLWRDDKVLAPTHGEIDEMLFQEEVLSNAQELDKPLGQRESTVIRKTFVFPKENT